MDIYRYKIDDLTINIMNTKMMILSPEMVTDKQRAEIIELLAAGGESYMVDIDRKLQENVKTFILAYDGDKMIGVRALKIPDIKYMESVFERCGHPEVSMGLEIGYACVSEDYRGKGIYREMTEEMLKFVDKSVYSVTRENNHGVIKTLTSLGFEILGGTFPSIHLRNELVVLVKVT